MGALEWNKSAFFLIVGPPLVSVLSSQIIDDVIMNLGKRRNLRRIIRKRLKEIKKRKKGREEAEEMIAVVRGDLEGDVDDFLFVLAWRAA